MNRTLLLLTLLVCFQSLFAQIQQPKRYELDINDPKESFFIVSAEEKGLLIFRQNIDQKVEKNKIAWDVQLLDTALEVKKTKILIIDRKYRLEAYDVSQDNFVMFFSDESAFIGNILLVNFNTNNLEHSLHEYPNEVPFELTDFRIKDETAVFGGDINNRTVAMMYNFTVSRGTLLSGFFNYDSHFEQILTDTGNKNLQIITSEIRNNQTYGITIRSYDEFGDQQFEYHIKGKENHSLLNARLAGKIAQNTVLSGTYSYKKRRETTRGFFMVNLGVEKPKIEYHSYADLDNFFNYMRQNRQERVKRKIKRKKIKGKSLQLNYRMNILNLTEDEDQSILLGEAYFPVYSRRPQVGPNATRGYFDSETETIATFGSGYDGYTNLNSPKVFDGNRITHAVIVAFNNNGDLMWDNSFEIDNVKSYDLRGHVKMIKRDNSIVMLYIYDQVIYAKIIDKDKILQSELTQPLRTKFESDEVISNEKNFEGFEKWYGNTFFSYGVSKIANKNNSLVAPKREVFFINKIVVD